MSGKNRGTFRLRRTVPVQLASYLLLRVVIMIVDMFPFESAPAVGKWLARILRFVDRKHYRIAVKNLEQSRIVPSGKIHRFIRKVYDHLGLSFVEMLMIPRLMQRHALERYVRLERFHVVDQVWKEGKGVIVAIGHLGNWELVGLAVNHAGYPLHSLARPVENPWVDRYLHRFRTSTGQEIISKYNALGSMVATLKKKGLLVIQVDQDARHNGVYVKFFDRPAATHRSPAVLALKYGSPIIVADIYREKGLHYCVISDPIRPEEFADDPDPVKALTQEITRVFEGCVRRHPEQWFWVHDRWKTAERQARVEPQAVL